MKTAKKSQRIRVTHKLRDIKMIPDAPSGMRYVAVGQNCWGKGVTAIRALENARSQGSRGLYVVHLVNMGAEVNEVDGTVYYDPTQPGTKPSMAYVRMS